MRQQVRAAIDQLPETYRTVLMLRDIEELDTPEVATMLGISGNAVKIRLHRARQALRTLLNPAFTSSSEDAGARAVV
jgi:RNA polymerase sigma-70 factor (ECF subfamily)